MADSRHNPGLTLIEVMVSLVIILILAALIWKMSGRLENQLFESRQKEAFTILDSALQAYYEVEGQFPLTVDANIPQLNTQELLLELNHFPESRVIIEKLPKKQIQNLFPETDPTPTGPELYDVWGRPVRYLYAPGMTFPILRSDGANGIPEPNTPGVSDDITNR